MVTMIRTHLLDDRVRLYTHAYQFREVFYALSKRSLPYIVPRTSGPGHAASATLAREKQEVLNTTNL
jgi:prolyl oligopeptidase PreP (S9A serine peptidase family)